jgi:hypothetical protein
MKTTKKTNNIARRNQLIDVQRRGLQRRLTSTSPSSRRWLPLHECRGGIRQETKDQEMILVRRRIMDQVGAPEQKEAMPVQPLPTSKWQRVLARRLRCRLTNVKIGPSS